MLRMNPAVRKYMALIGQRGGRASKRELSPDAARNMVKVREARRAFRHFYAQCFWSTDPSLLIGPGDVAWVAEQLMKQGGRSAWEAANNLCR